MKKLHGQQEIRHNGFSTTTCFLAPQRGYKTWILYFSGTEAAIPKLLYTVLIALKSVLPYVVLWGNQNDEYIKN